MDSAIAPALTWLLAVAVLVREVVLNRRADERRQAEQVRGSGGAGPWWRRLHPSDDGTLLAVSNTSHQPIYHAVVSLVLVSGAGPRSAEEVAEVVKIGTHEKLRAEVFVIPPGRWFVSVSSGWNGMQRKAAVEVAFRDAREVSWVRRANGKLERLPADPFAHFSVSGMLAECFVAPG